MDRLAGSSVTTSLGLLRVTGAGATKGGGGGGIRILNKEKISISHQIHEEKHRSEIRSTDTPFYYFVLSNPGSKKFRLLMSRTFWRAAGRLNKKALNI